MSEVFDENPADEAVPAPDRDPRAWPGPVDEAEAEGEADSFSTEPADDVSQGDPDDEPAAEASDESGEAGDRAEVDTSERSPEPTPPAEPAPVAPETGDLVIDAALRDLAQAPSDDLDAQIDKGEQVQRTLQGRLSDLGG